MADRENNLEPSIVRIYSATGKVQGAAFRISDKHLLTCAHVVGQALGIARITKEMPLAEITVDFPLVAAGERLIARVVRWQPEIPELSDIPVGERDIAIMELNSDAPAGSFPTRLVATDNYWGHSFRACGFPQAHDEGVWASGLIRGKQANGWIQIEDEKEIGFFVEKGFSGTLVWDEESAGVAGMVVGVEGSAKRRTAYMIPAPSLARVSADLCQRVVEINDDMQPLPLEPPEASNNPKSPFYVARRSDLKVLNIISRQGTTTTIKGPGQMGKSTLLNRMMQAATEMGKRVVRVDLQQFDQQTLEDGSKFFHQLCSWITYELDIEDRVEQYWTPSLGNIQRVTRFMRNYVLNQIREPLLLGMEEVDVIFSTAFRKDFFGMLRSWHEGRTSFSVLKQLDVVLVTSTEPYHFIDDLNQSPFAGDTIEVEDFTLAESADLNKRHGAPFSSEELDKLVKLVGGHPYLVRSALYQVASKQTSAKALLENATADDGPFSSHLGSHYLKIYDKDDLAAGLRHVIRDNICHDERVRIQLLGAGLIVMEGNAVKPRRPIYAGYFRRRLNV